MIYKIKGENGSSLEFEKQKDKLIISSYDETYNCMFYTEIEGGDIGNFSWAIYNLVKDKSISTKTIKPNLEF